MIPGTGKPNQTALPNVFPTVLPNSPNKDLFKRSTAIVAISAKHVGESIRPSPTWQEALKNAVRDAGTLCRVLELPPAIQTQAEQTALGFPIFAPWEFIARMQVGDPHDPLLRQVLPLAEELETVPGYTADPVGDRAATRIAGLLHKYTGRVLIVATGACAVHCRYCFRRHFPYAESPTSSGRWQAILDEIREDASIEEVLLSGGDPLTLPDSRLAELAERLAEIPHLRRLRVHTRLPIVIPQRVTEDLVAWLRGTRLTPLLVVHANHPHEIDDCVAQSVGRLIDGGIPVLNQTVLLRGVNDSTAVLAELSRRLIDNRVLPYYLHEMDRVAGAHHFTTPAGLGERIIQELRSILPGYAVPTLVREVPAAASKFVLA